MLHCATEESLENESGRIYRDCKLFEPKNKLDPEIARQLWDVSSKMTGITEGEKAL